MKDKKDVDTSDVDDFLEEESGVPPELTFDDLQDRCGGEGDRVLVCPSCHENELTQDQIDEQVEGEICTMCQYHMWEEL